MHTSSAAAVPSAKLPTHLQWLTLIYCLASLAHFVHNAEYIAYYPNMPAWLMREQVYMVWLAITSVGATALLLHRLGKRIASVALLGAYGAFGFDALGHYALALCSEHTLAQNLTIWLETASGAALLVACMLYLASHRRHA